MSTNLYKTLSFRFVCQSPPLCSKFALTHGLLDSAAEQLMVRRDFQAAFDTCERGLDGLLNAEKDRHGSWFLVRSVVLHSQRTRNKQHWISWRIKRTSPKNNPQALVPTAVLWWCLLDLTHLKVL